MRRRLVLVFMATSTLIVVALVVPLGFVVRRAAEDRAIDAARADASAVVPALVTGGTPEQIEAAVGDTDAGGEGRVTVMTSQGWTIGPEVETSALIDAALSEGLSDIGDVSGGREVVAAVATGPDELSAIRVFVPTSELRSGQWRAWGALTGAGVVLVGISVVVADRLARSVVRPAQDLAVAARRLGQGHLDTTVEPDGPDELVELAGAFNELGEQVSSMLERERELVGDLSHRLRTPLTKLRMRLDQIDDPSLAAALRTDVDDVTGAVNEVIHEARGMAVPGEGCDVADVVTERADFWSVLADDQQRSWRFERGSGRLWVGVARAELAAVVDVLLDNVFAHTSEGTSLLIGFGERHGDASIWVADGGDGIDPAVIERGESPSGSTGLGLAIVRRVASEAGGTLEISTSHLGGAEVAVSFPLADDPGGSP